MANPKLRAVVAGIVVKELSAVEVHPSVSNQHEFNGTIPLQKLLGGAHHRYQTRLMYLSDNDADTKHARATLTWYDAREKHPTRSELRCYFPATSVTNSAAAGDLMFLARLNDQTLLLVITKRESTAASQLRWLFGLRFDRDLEHGFNEWHDGEAGERSVGFIERSILEALGLEPDDGNPTEDDLEHILEKFGPEFPTTAEFSDFARSRTGNVDPLNDPDDALIRWLDREEELFRILERHLVQSHLDHGFSEDVDGFVRFSLAIQNRRKARAGRALENHLEKRFQIHSLKFRRSAVTENNSSTDFLFPGLTEYYDHQFDPSRLTALGAKTTCKDRWRQVLVEARRVEKKHLLTLEPGISINQTDEMKLNKLQLVIPAPIQTTYSQAQRPDLLTLENFIKLVQSRNQ